MTPRELLLYGIVALVPAVFYRGTTEVFEFPKTEFLATGALLLFGASLACEIERARSRGGRAWRSELGPRLGTWMRLDPLGASIVIFLASATLSALASIRPDAGIFGARESEAGLKTAYATAIVYFTSRSLASEERHFSRLLRAAAAGLAVAVSYAGLQLAGWDPYPWTRSATLGGLRRVPGTLGHANHLGAYIAMMLPPLAWLVTDMASRMRLLWIALALASLPILAATLSRGAWVACATGILVYGALGWRAGHAGGRGRRVALVAILLLLAAFLVPLGTSFRPQLLQRLRQITDLSAPSTQSRVHLWRAGILMAAAHPVLGVGTDAYLTAFPRYRTPDYWKIEWNGTSAKAHNELIQIAATQGAWGVMAALLVILFAARAVLGLVRHGDPGTRRRAAAAGGALAAFAIQDLASFTVASTGVLAAALAGWAGGAWMRLRTDAATKAAAGTPPFLNTAACVRPGRGAIAIGMGVAAVLWTVLVLLPWLADAAAARAMKAPDASEERVSGLTRAATLTPWDARYASELGRAVLTQGFQESGTERKRDALDRALAAFERATWLSPRDGELHALLGRTMAARHAADPARASADAARSEFEKALALEPENPNVLELVTQGYLDMGLTQEARRAAVRCAKLFPDYALPMADLGIAALLEGRPDAAADTLTIALRRNWHGQDAAEMAAKENYVAALREMRLRDALKK